jgi:hypothetical protein
VTNPNGWTAAITSIVSVMLGAAPWSSVAAQQNDYSLAPYVAFLAPNGKTPLAGLAFTVSGSPGFALRLSGRTALRNTYTGTFSAGTLIPPWGADADAVFALNGRPFGSTKRSGSTFAFVGYGAAGVDTAETRVVTKNWSYGIGTMLPLGSIVDLFADSRWRMQRFVLPTAKPHPERVKEIRVGLTFHLARNNPRGVWSGR